MQEANWPNRYWLWLFPCVDLSPTFVVAASCSFVLRTSHAFQVLLSFLPLLPQWVTNGWPASPSISKHKLNVSKEPYWPTLETTLFPATQTLLSTTFIILHWPRWWQWCCPEDWLLCPDDLLKLAAGSNIQHNWRERGTESVPVSPQ